MATGLVLPDTGAGIDLHLRRTSPWRKRKRHLRDLIGVIFGAAAIALALICLVLWLQRDSVRRLFAQQRMSTAAAPAVPVKKRPRARPALPSPGKPPVHETQKDAAPASRMENDSGTAALFTPWNETDTSSPFQSSQSPTGQGVIDELVFQRLEVLGIEPAKLCSDEVFLRRVYIDVLGTLPSAEEARQFLDDPSPEKRAKLIDAALERAEFTDYWAMKWSDLLRVKAEFPIKLWPNAAQGYHRWIRTAIKNNVPYDEFARELLTSSGSNFRKPQVNFYRAVQSKEPKALAQAVALTFLGERADQWPTERLEGMSVFFSQIGYKPTGEWKEEIVYFDRRKRPAPVHEHLYGVLPDGTSVQIPPGEDPRRIFANWLVRDDNPWFARVIANRVWCWLLGHGIVDPPDDVRTGNPPSNLALLNHLAHELVSADYDLKQLYRLILNSHTYQLACIPKSANSEAEKNFAHYAVRRLDAEVLIDAVCQITGTTESYSSIIPEPYTFLPDGTRAIALPDGSITSSFLEMFGRPPRDTGLESERNNHLTAAQALHFLNSNHVRNKLRQGPGIQDLLSKAPSADAAAESLYLAILSRRPTPAERSVISPLCKNPWGARDAAWALINSDEFLFRH
jgi:hypothetical protein